MSTYLITGASRGLGLALVSALASKSSSQVRLVVAAARSQTPALNKMIETNPGKVVYVSLDITSQSSIDDAVHQTSRALGGKGGLDVLVNNAGTLDKSFDSITQMSHLMEVLNVNVNGVQMTTSAFLPLLKQGQRKLVLNISSAMGSMALVDKFPFPTPAYKVSKAALNMLTVQWAMESEQHGISFILANPGWLKTDLGGDAAELEVDTGAKAVIAILDRSTSESNGKFFQIDIPGNDNYQGGELPW